MKRLLILCSVALVLNSCAKDDENCSYTQTNTVATSAEIAYLQSYAATNFPAAIQHPSGFFYQVNAAGTGAVPGLCSGVTARYAGYLIPSDVKFDENTVGANFTVGGLIKGWQDGLRLVAQGGNITLLIPPSLAYGATGNGSVPGNSYLKFFIQVDAVR